MKLYDTVVDEWSDAYCYIQKNPSCIKYLSKRISFRKVWLQIGNCWRFLMVNIALNVDLYGMQNSMIGKSAISH